MVAAFAKAQPPSSSALHGEPGNHGSVPAVMVVPGSSRNIQTDGPGVGPSSNSRVSREYQ